MFGRAVAATARVAAPARSIATRVHTATTAPKCAALAATAAAAGLAAWTATSTTVHAEEYESCQTIGDGLRAEFWKAKRKNVEILELESEPIQIMMTSLRDKNTSDNAFKLIAERVVFATLEHGLSQLPTAEKTVNTVGGHEYTGLAYEDGLKLCGVAMAEDGGEMLSLLSKLWPKLPVSHLQINRKTGKMKAVPVIEDMEDYNVILLAPILKTGTTVLKGIKRLEGYGVDQGNIMVISITAAPAAIDRLASETPEVSVVCASIEAGMDGKKRLEPGLGVFGDRYYTA